MLPSRRKSASLTVLCILSCLGLFALCPASLQGQYSPVGVTGPSSNRVDMVFMGDGYTSDQIPTTYWNDVQTLWTYLFGPPPPPIAPFPPPAPSPPRNFDQNERDPYVQYRRFFNTWRIDVVSAESGADNGSQLPQPRNTALNAGYGYGGGPQRFLYIDPDLGRSVLAQNLAGAPFTAEVPVVAVNDTLYGGGGGLFGYGPFAVYAAGDAFARQVALHELGHSFNGLGDEYDSPGAYTGPEPAAVNLSTDQTGAKWAPWLLYQDVPAVGVIGTNQGGLGSYTTGIWRPSVDSKMRNLGYWSSSPGYPNSVYGVPFNAVCREKIILDIYSLVRPLDAWSPNAAPVIDPQNPLSVTVVDPAVIQVAWSIDGAPVASGGSFQIQNSIGPYGAGRYTVTARAYDADPNNWVTASNRQLLEQSVNWSVQLSGASTSRWAAATGGQWSVGGNWAGGVPNLVDAAASFLDTPAALARTITVDVPVIVGTLNFDNANAYTLVGASTMTMQATGGPAIINVAGGSHTISPPVFLASNTNVNVWSGTLTLPGTVSGTGGLTKAGTGTLVLSNSSANLYGGTTTVAAGVLRANFGAGLSGASNLTLAGGVLEGLGNATFTAGLGVGAGQVQWTGSGGFSAYGGLMTVNIGGNPTPQTLTWGVVGGFVPSGSALVFGSSTANNQTLFLNPVDLNGGTETVTVLDNPNTIADFATLAGVLSNGGLTKAGPGTLVLAVANNYTGPTTVNAGTLAYGADNAINPGSAVTVNGGTLDLGFYTGTVGVVTLNGGSIVGSGGTLVSTVSYEVRSGTVSAVLAGLAPLNKADPYGTVVLATGANTYTGPTTIYGGALRAWGVGGAGLPATSNLTLAGGVLEGTGNVTFSRSLGQGPNQVQWTYNGGFSASGGVMTVDIGGLAQTLTWGGPGSPGSQYFVTNAAPTAGGLVFGSLTADNETRFLNPIDMNGQDCPVIVNDNPGTPADFATLAGVLSDSAAAPSSSSLTKLGPGTLVLSAANTYGTPTYIEGGALQANSGAGLPTASNLVFGNGVLQGSGAVTFIRGLGIGPDQVQWMYSGGFSANGGLMTVNIGANSAPDTLTWNVGSFVPDFGELIFGSDTADNETRFLNPIDLAGRTRTVRVNDNPSTSADFATLVGGLSNGGLTKEGPGTLVLSAANTYTGPTTVNAGTLRAGNPTAFGPATSASLVFGSAGTGTVQLNGYSMTVIGLNTDSGSPGTTAVENGAAGGTATLTVNNATDSTFAGVFRKGAAGNLALTKTGTGLLTLTGNSGTSIGGYVRVNAGSLTISGGGRLANAAGSIGFAAGDTGSVTVTGAGSEWNSSSTLKVGESGSNNTLTVSAGGRVTNNAPSYVGANSGSNNNAMTVTGTGSEWIGQGTGRDWLLGQGGGTNNILNVSSGGTMSKVANLTLYSTGSVVNLGDGNSISTVSANTVGLTTASARLNFNSGRLTARANGAMVSGSGQVQLVGPAYLSTTFADSTIANVIYGDGSLTKEGTGTLTLSGVNTYTGGTTVSEGTLLVSNTAGSGTGTGPVTVSAATLGGTGFINGLVTLTGDSTLTSTGTLTISNSTLTIRGLANQLAAGTVLTSGDVTIEPDAVFIINGTLGGGTGSLIVYGTLLGKGTINKSCVIEAGGVLSPGAPSTIQTTTQILNAEAPQTFSFEIGAATPNYATPSNSVNDVIRLTDADTPFANASGAAPAALSADTVIDVYFLDNDPALGGYKAEFFAATNFTDAVAGATYQYWRLDPRGSRYHNGNFYSPLDAALVGWSVVRETATFGGASTSGFITEFMVVPEPATLTLVALGGLAMLSRRRK